MGNPLPLPPSACSQLLLLKPSQRLMLMLSMATMAMDITLVMPTMDTMDTHMPTTVMPTMERDLLMLKPMLMLTTDTHTLTVTVMPTMDTMDMDITSVMPTMDTTDTHMPTTVMPTTERDLLMLKPMLMLTTDTH